MEFVKKKNGFDYWSKMRVTSENGDYTNGYIFAITCFFMSNSIFGVNVRIA